MWASSSSKKFALVCHRSSEIFRTACPRLIQKSLFLCNLFLQNPSRLASRNFSPQTSCHNLCSRKIFSKRSSTCVLFQLSVREVLLASVQVLKCETCIHHTTDAFVPSTHRKVRTSDLFCVWLLLPA